MWGQFSHQYIIQMVFIFRDRVGLHGHWECYKSGGSYFLLKKIELGVLYRAPLVRNPK